jgi:uncharacterized protein YbaA (DUF1428 family)
MSFVEITAAAVPTANKAAYLAHAKEALALFKRHGALSVVENWGHEVPEGEVTSFPLAVKCQPDETVVIAWITWPDKATQVKAWEDMMPEMEKMGDLPFDGKRMIFGTFDTILEG